MELLVMRVLKMLVPTELVAMIIHRYMYALQRGGLEPGHAFYNTSCWHLIRFQIRRKSETLYPKTLESWSCTQRDELIEVYDNRDFDINCNKCDRHWRFVRDGERGLKKQIVCFCGAASSQFPCGKCWTAECSVSDCRQLTNNNVRPILCKYHFECGACKEPYKYEFNKPRALNGFNGWISAYCGKCKVYFDGWDFDENMYQKIFEPAP